MSRQTAGMGVRFGVVADTETECAAGLLLLAPVGIVVTQRPAQLAGGRWIARAVPVMAAAPVGDGPGREGQASGLVSPHRP